VDDREAGNHPHVLQIAQPLAIFGTELFAGPVYGFGSRGIETIERLIRGAVIVVISLHHRDVQLADNIEAFFWVAL